MSELTTTALDDNTWDLEIIDGSLHLLHDLDALQQLIKQRLQVWQGEYYLDTTLGVNWDGILGSKFAPTESDITDVIEGVGWGLRVVAYSQTVTKERRLDITFTADSKFGRITDFSVIL